MKIIRKITSKINDLHYNYPKITGLMKYEVVENNKDSILTFYLLSNNMYANANKLPLLSVGTEFIGEQLTVEEIHKQYQLTYPNVVTT